MPVGAATVKPVDCAVICSKLLLLISGVNVAVLDTVALPFKRSILAVLLLISVVLVLIWLNSAVVANLFDVVVSSILSACNYGGA